MNYYQVLGVDQKASADEIKRAYRKLASQHHPDKGGDKTRFQEIQAAYDTLSDAQRRQQHDMELAGFGGPGGVRFQWQGNPGNIDDIFAQFGFPFGGDMFGRRPQRRNKDLRIEIPIPLVSTLENQRKTVSVQTTNGQRQTVEVDIPRGISHGTNIKYPGLGDNLFNTLPPGDLYVQINVHPTENFRSHGIDLHTYVSVNCLHAIVGGTVKVQGLDLKTFELTIPPGTQHGTKFRIPAQGLYQMNTEQRGNLYVEIIIEIPTNLDEQQQTLIRNIINNQ